MERERWQKIEILYDAALQKSPRERSAFLAQACEGDAELQAEVENLLDQGSSLLARPAWEAFSSLVDDPGRPLARGTQLGPYRIEEPLGEGGMGKVYKARDTRLDRVVAIKVLAAEFSGRFAREARAISTLNHPNICTLHDVGPNYLVMELLDGPTLAERIKQGPIALEEALRIAWQIAGALEAAHERGIVHRDLKPANIKITPDGAVKVLDFGLAKVVSHGAERGAETTQTLGMTEVGAVVGTASYMAPEQARGLPVDQRADIWAFGVVLYEMITGDRLFRGDTLSDTLAVVLTREPEWSRVPPKVERLLRRCLERDPKRRLRSIGDAPFLVEDDRPESASTRGGTPWKITVALLVVALAALAFLWAPRRRPAPAVLRLSVDSGEDATLSPQRGTTMSLSPDGSRIVYLAGRPPGPRGLSIRRLDQTKPMRLAETEGAEAPFFSADGKSIAFFANGKLKRIDANGGSPVTLADAPSPRDGSWGENDEIVFAGDGNRGLMRVAAGGGTMQVLTEPDPKMREFSHRYPQVLPGSRAVLFTNSPDRAGEGKIEVLLLATGQRKVLAPTGGYAHYLPSGHLVYIHNNVLFAAPMNLDRLEVTGPGRPVLNDVSFHPSTGAAAFTFSQTGIFVYLSADPEERNRPIGILDGAGNLELLPVPRARYVRARLAPDGKRLAVAIDTGLETHIWMYEFGSQRFARLVLASGSASNPVWSPDGQYLAYSSTSANPGPGIYWLRTDGAGEPQRLVDGDGLVPSSFSPQTGLVYGTPDGLYRLPVAWSRDAPPKLGVPEKFPHAFMETPSAVSPDDRWITYVNGQLGVPEVFVRSLRGLGGPWQASTVGTISVWSRAGSQLFYHGVDLRIMVTPYSVSGDSFSPAPPHPWNETRVERFDLFPDGKRALVIPAAEQKEPTHATFLLNFMDSLPRR
jgi:Tol biopolymer transport system component